MKTLWPSFFACCQICHNFLHKIFKKFIVIFHNCDFFFLILLEPLQCLVFERKKGKKVKKKRKNNLSLGLDSTSRPPDCHVLNKQNLEVWGKVIIPFIKIKNMTVSPEDAFYNTTVEYGVLVKQRMTMRMKLIELRKTRSENEI